MRRSAVRSRSAPPAFAREASKAATPKPWRDVRATESAPMLGQALHGHIIRVDRCLGPRCNFGHRHSWFVKAGAEAERINSSPCVFHEIFVGDSAHGGDHQVCGKNGADPGNPRSELRRVPKGTDKETARNGDSRCTCGSITRFYRVDALRNRKALPRPFQRRRQGLRDGRPVDVLGVAREQELVVVALGGQHLRHQFGR